MKDALNPFKIAQQQLDDAAQRLGLDPAMHELLRWPMQELKVTLPVKMDDGLTRVMRSESPTTPHAGGPRAVSDGIRTRPLIPYVHWQHG